ncbi:MAG: acyl-CoA/acyl-ACP dehydrogenase [Actinobacteria bacterium]|nr:acyl-CoA/acyl-ACP dehydrogenase [Actinomycetota bacterium]
MNLAFNEEQEALRDTARGFLSKRYPIERVAEITDGDGFEAAEWAEVTNLGWTGISVPEDEGGLGLGFVEEAIVLEEAARVLYPGPLFSTVGLARPALAGDDLHAVAEGQAVTLAWAEEPGRFEAGGLATRADASGRLTGRKRFVPDVGAAGLIVVVADGPAVFVVDRDGDGVTWTELPTVDRSRRLAEVSLEGAAGRAVEGDADAILAAIRVRGAAAAAAEAVGAAQSALDRSIEHVGSREQFGRAIGSFQAVSHQLADSFMDLENARSLAYWAAWAVATGDQDAARAASTAKAFATEAAIAVCERAIQVHGGIGFTWESPLHRWYKRALWLAGYLGWPGEHRAAVAASLLA